ncbi:MAG: cryptochrome/photolyase family protein [Chitinophagaceae bacterium]
MKTEINICWLRRDLRLNDQAALYHALTDGISVLPLFIFDRDILDLLEDKDDKRVTFIHETILKLKNQLQQFGADMEVHYGRPELIFKSLFEKYTVRTLFFNHDYEPYAIKRDTTIAKLCEANGVKVRSCKDQVIFEKSEVVKDDGKPYTVFTPFSRKWKIALTNSGIPAYPSEEHVAGFLKMKPTALISLETMGFIKSPIHFPVSQVSNDIIEHYKAQRDFPAVRGTSRLSVHLRFGTISIRQLAKTALGFNEAFLNELIWRDFYHMILWHFPHVGEGKAFKKEYDFIEWRNNEAEFEKWCAGNTGYPIVDAGMRELNETGFMHNRVRMIVASFLTKHLLIDWRWGEAYFARKLLDFDLAANNGGWQWAAGSGCDAAPYFRIFNPYTQTQKFDPKLAYIRKWVPEFESFTYPTPIVQHELARKRCLEVYAKALKKE